MEGFDDDAAFQETVKKLEYDLKRARKKDMDGTDEPVVCDASFAFNTSSSLTELNDRKNRLLIWLMYQMRRCVYAAFETTNRWNRF